MTVAYNMIVPTRQLRHVRLLQICSKTRQQRPEIDPFAAMSMDLTPMITPRCQSEMRLLVALISIITVYHYALDRCQGHGEIVIIYFKLSSLFRTYQAHSLHILVFDPVN